MAKKSEEVEKKAKKEAKAKAFFTDLSSVMGNDDAGILEDDLGPIIYIDTGSYAFNGLLSGTIFGGVASNKVTAFAGEESTGKTFYLLAIAKNFLDSDPNAGVLYFESEGSLRKDDAWTEETLRERNIDVSRFFIIPVSTVEEFRTQAVRVLDKYNEQKTKMPMMMCLDSLGQLSTSKEMADVASGSEKKDMTRAQVIRGAFRTIQQKLAAAKIPLLLSNHTYDVVGSYFPTKEMAGGGGVKYAATSIIFLSKSKEKEEKTVDKRKIIKVVGANITCIAMKSRVTREYSKVITALSFDSGLDRYAGLEELAVEGKVFVEDGDEYRLPDGSLVFKKELRADPAKYYTMPLLQAIDVFVGKKFKFGKQDEIVETEGTDEQQ